MSRLETRACVPCPARRPPFPPAGCGFAALPPDLPPTSRELAICGWRAGRSNQEIAERLIMAVSTVKWYLREIYHKLGSTNRIEAVARARALGLLR